MTWIRRGYEALASIALLATVGAGCGGGGGGSGTCTPPNPFPAQIDHGPMVALPAPTSMAIAWWTTTADMGAVEWGTDATYGTTTLDPMSRAAHRVDLTGLSPATTYHYRLLSAGAPVGDDHDFRTPPTADAPVRFSVLGDTGTGCDPETEVLAQVAAEDPDFVIDTGDVAYKSGTVTQVRNGWSIPFADILAHAPVFPCLGNHDIKTMDGNPLFEACLLPTNPVDHTPRFYSFDYGPCHVATLDSNADLRPGTPQHDWLQTDLSATTAPWTFVFFHHPAYSSSNHGSTASVDVNLVPVFDANHTDLVLNGHDHDYERTFPMFAGSPVDAASDPTYADPQGTVYVVTGGGGFALYKAAHSAFTAISESVHNHVTVAVDGPILTLKGIRPDGSTIDTLTITKSVSP